MPTPPSRPLAAPLTLAAEPFSRTVERSARGRVSKRRGAASFVAEKACVGPDCVAKPCVCRSAMQSIFQSAGSVTDAACHFGRRSGLNVKPILRPRQFGPKSLVITKQLRARRLVRHAAADLDERHAVIIRLTEQAEQLTVGIAAREVL